jgi:hypothetical protein
MPLPDQQTRSLSPPVQQGVLHQNKATSNYPLISAGLPGSLVLTGFLISLGQQCRTPC